MNMAMTFFICQYLYTNDIFTNQLQFSVEASKNQSAIVRMDTPTPYGIRVYQYDAAQIQCGADQSLNFEAVARGSTKKIQFSYPTKDEKTGTLTYFDFSGNKESTLELECSPDKIKDLCAQK